MIYQGTSYVYEYTPKHASIPEKQKYIFKLIRYLSLKQHLFRIYPLMTGDPVFLCLPYDIIWRHKSAPSWVQVMSRQIFCANPLP